MKHVARSALWSPWVLNLGETELCVHQWGTHVAKAAKVGHQISGGTDLKI